MKKSAATQSDEATGADRGASDEEGGAATATRQRTTAASAEPAATEAGAAAPPAEGPRKSAGKRPRKGGATKGARPRKRKSSNPLAAFSEEEAEDPRRRAKRRKRLGTRSKARDAQVKPSPPLTETDPLGRYLAGEMVPCPVGCGGFSEVVHIGTQADGSGEVWFECLSCAQRKAFEVDKLGEEEIARIGAAVESGGEVYCPRCNRNAILRRRGKQLVCPDCGIMVAL